MKRDQTSQLQVQLRIFQQRDRLRLVSDDYQNRVGWDGKFNLNGMDGEGEGLLDPDYVDPDYVEKSDEEDDSSDDGGRNDKKDDDESSS